MAFRSPVLTFLKDESGAVTTDWVPLVSATVGLGLAVTGVVSGGVGNLAGDIRAALGGDLSGGVSGSGIVSYPQNA